MSKKDKLIKRLLKKPKDFTFDEMESLLLYNVRISPELHRSIAVYAIEHGKSLNAAVEEAIGNMVGI